MFQVQSSKFEGFGGAEPAVSFLYRNDGGGRFREVGVEAGVASSGWGFGATVGDYDNDGDPDLFLTYDGPARLYRNEGMGRFREVGSEAGVAVDGWNASSAFFDPDVDGDLDLYVTSYLDFDPSKIYPTGDREHPCTYRGILVVCGPKGLIATPDHYFRNNGDGTFTDATREVGMEVPEPYYGLGVVTLDAEGDGDVDVYVANDISPNFLFINDGRGSFTEEGLLRGAAYSGDGRDQASMGLAAGDPDADGDLDLFVTHFSHDYSTFYLNDGLGFFEDATMRHGLGEPTIRYLQWGTSFEDLDNDGDQDLFIADSHVYPEADEVRMGTTFLQECMVFLNDGAARFTRLVDAGPALEHLGAHRGAAFGDIDEDGDIDVVVARMFDRPGFYRNDLPPSNHWLSIRLVGTTSNRDAVGARVWVTVGGRRRLLERKGGGSINSASDGRLHVGLGERTSADSVEIRWPGGRLEKFERVAGDRTVTYIEPAGGGRERSVR